jgi:cell division protein FtsX
MNEPPAPRRRRGLLVLVAVVALLVGVGGTAAAFLLYEPVMERLDPPEYTYSVAIFLKADVTDAQRQALKEALDGAGIPGGVEYESREQAYANFKKLYKDSPELIEKVRPDTLPESFQFETKGTNKDFDCGLLAPVKDLPGIDDVTVTRFSKDDRKNPMKRLSCPLTHQR